MWRTTKFFVSIHLFGRLFEFCLKQIFIGFYSCMCGGGVGVKCSTYHLFMPHISSILVDDRVAKLISDSGKSRMSSSRLDLEGLSRSVSSARGSGSG